MLQPLLLLRICLRPVTSPKREADYIINEVNLAHSLIAGELTKEEMLRIGQELPSTGNTEFIELKLVATIRAGQLPKTHEELRLVMIKICECEEPEIVFMANSTFDSGEKFWVLGADDIRHVTHVKFTDETKVIFHGCPWVLGDEVEKLTDCGYDRLPDGAECPVGIILVEMKPSFNPGNWDRPFISRSRSSPQISINALLPEIKEGLEDFIFVFGKKTTRYPTNFQQQPHFQIFR